MDERRYLDVISGQQPGLAAALLRGGLTLAVPAYGAVVAGRNWLFDRGLRRVQQADAPVVSVGNITTGGTGKTPVVAWVAEWYRARGARPCLVSRGYRSLEAGGNDEQRVLAQLCPQVPHVQNRDRVAAARKATRTHRANVVILDDGFQHRRLRRDVDIVLIDATNPWGYGHLLPRGLLREPRSALRRADVIVLTRVDQVTEQTLRHLRGEVRRQTGAPLAEVVFRPTQAVSFGDETASVNSLAGQTLLAFCGIGNPDSFRGTLQTAGLPPANDAFVSFPDHHHYTAQDVRQLVERAAAQGATALVTTQKDLVKLDPAWDLPLPVWAVVIGADVVAGQADLERALSAVVPPTPNPPHQNAN